MEQSRPLVLSIAGFDPSGGAGILADIKTFEQHKVYGLGVCTALTLQTADEFFSVRWEDERNILQSVEKMLGNYQLKAIKIGIVENIIKLERIVTLIHQYDENIKIVLDTVITSSTGFKFWDEKMYKSALGGFLPKVCVITPNYEEIMKLVPAPNPKKAAQKLSGLCGVLLKGGHNSNEVGVDYLYTKNNVEKLLPGKQEVFPKHGSGCVLSAAITANMALGFDLADSCKNAKVYIEQFLNSNTSLLGYHNAE